MNFQHRPNFGKEEADACYKYMMEDTFITEFKRTEEFEKVLADFIGVKHCIATTSGTTAIILALMSLDLEKGDEVIVPNYTMIATINAVKFIGATPVIIDVDPETFTMNPRDISDSITEKTKVVLHVSLNNRCKDLENISKICEEKNITLVEDSAQSLGCKYKGRSFGTWGKIGCFSLSTPKIISTGQGGFCVTDDDELSARMRKMKNFGRASSGNDVYDCFGLNLKITDLQAVIGLEQMKKLPGRIEFMRKIYRQYYDCLSSKYRMIAPVDEDWFPWFVDIFVDDREKLRAFLKEKGIGTRPVYPEINKTLMYYTDDTLENSAYVSSRGLFLPCHTLLTEEEVRYICECLLEYKK